MSKKAKRSRSSRRRRARKSRPHARTTPQSEPVPTLREARQITSRLRTPLSEYVVNMRAEAHP
jgi:hypothetical protein